MPCDLPLLPNIPNDGYDYNEIAREFNNTITFHHSQFASWRNILPDVGQELKLEVTDIKNIKKQTEMEALILKTEMEALILKLRDYYFNNDESRDSLSRFIDTKITFAQYNYLIGDDIDLKVDNLIESFNKPIETIVGIEDTEPKKHYYLRGDKEKMRDAIASAREVVEEVKSRSLVDMRTFFDQPTTDEVMKEFNDLLDKFLDPEVDTKHTEHYSETGLFLIICDTFQIVYDFRSSRYETRKSTNYSDRATLFSYNYRDGYAAESFYPYGFGVGRERAIEQVSKLKRIFHQRMYDLEWVFNKDTDYDDSYFSDSRYYSTAYLFGSKDVEKAVKSIIGITLSQVKPNTINNVQMCDEDDTKIEMTFKGRKTIMKIGKGIRKVLKHHKVDFTDDELKKITNKLSVSRDNYEFIVVEGDDIDTIYRRKNYDDSIDTGSLAGSCMGYDSCADDGYFELYKDKAKVLVLREKGSELVTGRVILWDNVDCGDEKFKVMDRIYANEKHYQWFFDWASENGYYRRRYQSFSSSDMFIAPHETDAEYFIFTIDACFDDYSCVPYMDTFTWGDDYVITNEEDYGHFRADDTDGHFHHFDEEDEDCY